MESKRIGVMLFLLVGWLLVAGLETRACSCAPVETPCEAYNSASSLFIGLVTSVSVSAHGGYSSGNYEINVEEVFVGKLGSTVRVSASSLLCGYEFQRDKHYLIYASGDRKDSETLFVTYCSRTRLLDEADEDLQFLGSRRPGSVGGRIYGTILRLEQIDSSRVGVTKHPVAGTIVRIEGEVSSHDVVTDEKGWYEVVARPGAYRIEVMLPEAFLAFRHASGLAYLNDCGCAKLDFYIYRRVDQ